MKRTTEVSEIKKVVKTEKTTETKKSQRTLEPTIEVTIKIKLNK